MTSKQYEFLLKNHSLINPKLYELIDEKKPDPIAPMVRAIVQDIHVKMKIAEFKENSVSKRLN